MKTILSLYEKAGVKPLPNYSKSDVVTKQKSKLAKANYTLTTPEMPNLVQMESSYDLDQYDKYIS